MNKLKLLLLDIDGTVRVSKSGATFINNEDDIILNKNIKEKIKKYMNLGYEVVGVSNQAGVAHGFKTKSTVQKEMKKTGELLGKNIVFPVYICVFDEKGTHNNYAHYSLQRKPNIGMLAVIEEDYVTKRRIFPDWKNSLFVGDREEDFFCADIAGIPFQHIDDFLLGNNIVTYNEEPFISRYKRLISYDFSNGKFGAGEPNKLIPIQFQKKEEVTKTDPLVGAVITSLFGKEKTRRGNYSQFADGEIDLEINEEFNHGHS